MVPNVPCGVERLKQAIQFYNTYEAFLMYRVELKGLWWRGWGGVLSHQKVPNVPCGVERYYLKSQGRLTKSSS